MLVVLLATAAAAQDQIGDIALQNRRCLECHGRSDLAELGPDERLTMVARLDHLTDADRPSVRPGLYIDYERVYAFSVHGSVACISCHTDCEELPHPERVQRASCVSCHEQQVTEFSESVHGRAIAVGRERAAHCSDCHGTHDILSAANPQSRTFKLKLPYTCGQARCHSNTEVMEEAQVRQPLAATQYIDSMHGRGLTVDGLIVAPSCNDCHGVHSILPSTDPESTIHKNNVPHTCGKCHLGVEAIYNESIHGQLLIKGDERGPVCATCHTAHEIIKPGETAFKLASDDRCGQCHEDRLERYRETFHGKAIELGLPNVAACYDCHGHHDIVPIADPRSRLHGEKKVETCRKCHEGANARFAQYIAHADHANRKDYPVLFWTFVFMTSIVVGTFVFFGVHTVLWFFRSAALYIKNPKAFREAKITAVRDDEEFVRFRPIDRFLHGLVITSFLLLVATGMPLKFHHTHWAQWMVNLMGGLEIAGGLHRLGAIITFIYFGIHLFTLVRALFRFRHRFKNDRGRYTVRQAMSVLFGPEMPLPNWTDVKDWMAHQKWFFGRGPRPQFDKWTYWEKFDYFAVFWGVAIIGLSGLVMWFPVAMTKVLPGWLINVALIIHSDEALLAAGFIFTFHFFNVHFRLEKFPMDPVIFSGRISKAEMLHERKRWYDRLKSEGRLDAVRVRDEWAQWKKFIHPLGFLAFLCGVVLLVLIFYAMGTRLLQIG